MRTKLITPPTLEPVTRSEAKSMLGITGTYDDVQIDSLIRQARQECEMYQRKKYFTQTLEIYLDDFPDKRYIDFVDCSPIQSIEFVKYTTDNNEIVVFEAENYYLDNVSEVNRLVLNRSAIWPYSSLIPANGVQIRVIAGVTAQKVGDIIVSTLPEAIKWAMELQMRVLYDNPDNRDVLMNARNQLLKSAGRVMLV